VFVYITQYYTAGRWRPVKEIVDASRTGPATNIIVGTAVGFETTLVTALAIGAALVISFILGVHSDLPNGGIFGTAVATMGMLMSAAYILSMDTFGPITDNANGIIEMSGAPGEARDITDALDAVGNTTKALTKGYAMASAGLAAFLLFSAYLDKVKEHFVKDPASIYYNKPLTSVPFPVDISGVAAFVSALLGVMLVFVFSSLAIRAVGQAAGKIIEEVRRQFREDPGIMAGTSRPDYGRAVDITARAALRGMIAPGLLVVGAPVVIGVVFRLIYKADLLRPTALEASIGSGGPESVAALLMVGTIGGVILATFFNNVGGAWDTAKKYIPQGGGGWRHRRRPLQGHGGAFAARAGEAAEHDHAGAGAAVHLLADFVHESKRRPGICPVFLLASCGRSLVRLDPHVHPRIEEKRVVLLLLADRARRPVTGEDDGLVRQGEQLLADAGEEQLAVAAGQVEPPYPPLKEGVAGEHHPFAIEADVAVGVPGTEQDLELEIADVDLVAVLKKDARLAERARPGAQQQLGDA
jgi:hypothetical protein